MPDNDYDKFKNLTFERFKELARDTSLTRYEKIGFPNSYREGKEENIFADITRKLDNLNQKSKIVMDIGPGCSGLAFMIIELCRKNEHTLILIDSEEMLSYLPDEPFIIKVPGRYPQDCTQLFGMYAARVDVILVYSVIQYVFVESNVFDFVDKALTLLAEGGEMLIGDIPNISMRKRFFASSSGVRFHQQFTGTSDIPAVKFNQVEAENIDDAVVLALLLRCRIAGYHAYLLPQANDLPMANRREDILIVKP